MKAQEDASNAEVEGEASEQQPQQEQPVAAEPLGASGSASGSSVAIASSSRAPPPDIDDCDEEMLTITKMKLSPLSLAVKLPKGGVHRPFARMRGTINNYCNSLARPMGACKLVAGTLQSLRGRFEKQSEPIRLQASVEMQIAFGQLLDRIKALIVLHKAMKGFNDSQNMSAFDNASAPLTVLEKYLQVGGWRHWG